MQVGDKLVHCLSLFLFASIKLGSLEDRVTTFDEEVLELSLDCVILLGVCFTQRERME